MGDIKLSAESALENQAEQQVPLYEKLKAYVRSRVDAGEWQPDHRVPSENEFVDMLGISRMTVNRALRELAAEGVVVRIRGKGSFVAPKKRSSLFQSVPNIADEIRARGGSHSPQVVLLRRKFAALNWRMSWKSRPAGASSTPSSSTRRTTCRSRSRTVSSIRVSRPTI